MRHATYARSESAETPAQNVQPHMHATRHMSVHTENGGAESIKQRWSLIRLNEVWLEEEEQQQVLEAEAAARHGRQTAKPTGEHEALHGHGRLVLGCILLRLVLIVGLGQSVNLAT